MKKYNDYFLPLLGNEELKASVIEKLESKSLFHANLILGEDGCGKNLFARLLASAYLEDENGLVLRGVHPDCITVEGTGASGMISVESIRTALYELNKSAVTADGKRVAIIKIAASLNASSANALLKELESPPSNVIFLITARSEDELLATIVSRCGKSCLAPLTVEQCADAVSALFPTGDKSRIRGLCELYGGRLGLVKNALSSPERLALCDCAVRFCSAAIKGDRLAMLSELECAPTRDTLKALLYDSVMCLKAELAKDFTKASVISAVTDSVFTGYNDIDRNINIKLLCTEIVARL